MLLGRLLLLLLLAAAADRLLGSRGCFIDGASAAAAAATAIQNRRSQLAGAIVHRAHWYGSAARALRRLAPLITDVADDSRSSPA